MKVLVPSYYNSFKCIAGKCRHSCCIGWEIDIDGETLKKYRSVSGDFGKRLRESIQQTEDETSCFILDENERCPFLNGENLCDIYINLGESSLCRICADHPRFRNFLSCRTETGLGICCEEASRLILSQKEKFSLVAVYDDGEDERLTEDEEYILSLRGELTELLYSESLTLDEKTEKILSAFGFDYMKKSAGETADFLLTLEMLDPKWGRLLENLKDRESETEKIRLECFDWEFINLIVYFLYRHMINCTDSEDLGARICFSIFAFKIIKALCINKYAEEGKCEFEDLAEFARMFSSEIEYSQENTDAVLEEIKGRKKDFSV